MNKFNDLRQQMIDDQLVARGLHDQSVLDAISAVPREEFVATDLVEFAYSDSPLPIEASQTISQPYIVALMTAALELKPEDRVLEVGTGSGYAAAILGEIARKSLPSNDIRYSWTPHVNALWNWVTATFRYSMETGLWDGRNMHPMMPLL